MCLSCVCCVHLVCPSAQWSLNSFLLKLRTHTTTPSHTFTHINNCVGPHTHVRILMCLHMYMHIHSWGFWHLYSEVSKTIMQDFSWLDLSWKGAKLLHKLLAKLLRKLFTKLLYNYSMVLIVGFFFAIFDLMIIILSSSHNDINTDI